MAVRYRVRLAGEEHEWGPPRRLEGVMTRVRREQRRNPGPSRFRRRDQSEWTPWRRRIGMRYWFRRNLKASPVQKIWQFQVGGEGGPVFAVMKYRASIPTGTLGQQVIAEARTCIGIPYGFADANGPDDPGTDSLDCSGLTEYCWGTVGVPLPHAARLQQVAGNVVTFSDENRCVVGDLVLQWFPNSRGIPPGTASHVGLWLGPGKQIDTRSPANPVAVRDIDRSSVVCYGHPIAGGGQI